MLPPHIRRLRDELGDRLDGLGDEARAWGPTAAALHAFDGWQLCTPFHFVVPRGHNLQRVGHHIHTTSVLPLLDCETVDGLRVTSPTRTLIDLAAVTTTTSAQLTAALDGALRDLLTTEDFLHRRLAQLRGRGRHGVPRLLAAIEGVEVTRGAHSWLEREFLRLVAAAGITAPNSQEVMGRRHERLIRVDFRFPGTPVIVEVLGYRYHRTTLQLQVDAERINHLVLAGYVVLQFTYDHVVKEPQWVIEQLTAALFGNRAA